jgi:predicted amidohydrolase
MSEKETFDLFVLPEMFASGFSMHPKNVAETMVGETVSWMKSLALKKNCAICGSLVIEENNSYYNRFIFVHPNQEIDFYNKRHLFSLVGEEKVYTKGTSKVIINYKGWKICPQICYDLRFPTFSRNQENYDLLLYVANWPKDRIQAWNILLKARAIENLCYTIGVNRIGTDHNNHQYSGHSQVIDELGNIILAAEDNFGVYIINLNKEKMLETRKKLNFLNDKDAFEITF